MKESEIYPDGFTDAFSVVIVSLLSESSQKAAGLTETAQSRAQCCMAVAPGHRRRHQRSSVFSGRASI
eukprot:4589865-Pyramimonas_sp.AAC.1